MLEYKLRFDKYINLNKDVTIKLSMQNEGRLLNDVDKDQEEDKWKQVTKRKRKHQVIAGKNMEDSTKNKKVPKIIALHV